MTDDSYRERRESVFKTYKKLHDELNELDTKRAETYEAYDEKYEEVKRVKNLIDVMMKHDCCPVEAQLTYIDELDNKNSSRMAKNGLSGYPDDCVPYPSPPTSIKEKLKRKLSNKLYGIALKLIKD